MSTNQRNFFEKLSVSSNNFSDHTVSWDFNSVGLVIINESSTSGDIVEYSFNGTDIHGDLDPDLASAGMSFDHRYTCQIWFRRRVSGTPVTVRLEVWG